MRSISYYLLFFSLLIFNSSLYAQDPALHEHHPHESNEIGLGLGVSYNVEEAEWAPAVHAHYLRYLGEEKMFGLSGGFESILDEHTHYSITIGIHYRLFDFINLGISPGFSRSTVEKKWEFVSHFEAVTEFEMGFMHLGPMVEYAIGFNHSHALIGLHLGFGF